MTARRTPRSNRGQPLEHCLRHVNLRLEVHRIELALHRQLAMGTTLDPYDRSPE